MTSSSLTEQNQASNTVGPKGKKTNVMVGGEIVPLDILVEEEAMKTKLQAETKPALKNKERES
jgi:hypothetical protein